MVIAKVFILVKHFEGYPKESDFKLIEEKLRPITNGEFLVEAVYLSIDPYMKAFEPGLPLGKPFIGSQVAKIIETKNPKYEVGKYVIGPFGWRTHTIATEDLFIGRGRAPQLVLKQALELKLSVSLGAAGMVGNAAYFGFTQICKPQPGETVVVSGAAGGVGSQVGQIAKIMGCKVIGILGSDEKGKWIVDELGFDHFINYNTDNVDEALKKYAPNGVDCYFDNVGGAISSTVIYQMNKFGRVSVCGAISGYNGVVKVKSIYGQVVSKELVLEGFSVSRRWSHRWNEGIIQNVQWIKEGKLKYPEHITEGFENTIKALVDMLKGVNVGKSVVKV